MKASQVTNPIPIPQPAECNKNKSECTEVIVTEQPTQPPDNFTLSPEVEIGEDIDSSVPTVEQALSSVHFNEATGFILKYTGPACCPSLEIIPKYNHTPLAHIILGLKITGSPKDKCHCCCCFPPLSINGTRKWQTMTLKQNEQEILHFLYCPMVWFCRGRKDRLVDIYIPQRNQRIGFIRQGSKFSDGMVLTDCVSKSVFVTETLETAPFAMTVLSQQGTPIAIAQPLRSLERREWTTWTNFELKFNTNLSSNLLPVSSKTIVLVAFACWAISYREETARSMLLWSSVAIFITILLVVITILYDSHWNY